MAVSAFQKLVNRLFKEFTLRHGREPVTAKEWVDLQNEAVRYFNRTKGAPTKPKAPPFQGWKPKVIPGGKGIESLLKSGDVKKGVAPKTKLSTLEGKKQKLDAAISKEEWIAKKHRENKEAVERFKEKNPKFKKSVEDYRDEGDWDPGGFAGGGPVNLQQLINMYVEEGMSHEDAVQAAEVAQNLPWDTLTKAQGGRIGLGAGGLAKGAKWFINSLKKNLADIEAGHPRFKVVPAKDQETLKVGYRTFIKELEAGGEVPVEALEAISKNPQYYKTKKVVRSQDPDLAEVEELIDEKVFGDVRQELKDFEVVGRKPQASGGLAYMLGEPNTRTEALQEFGVVTDPWGMYTDPSLYAQGERSTGAPGRGEYAGGGKVGHGPWTIGRTPPGPQSQPEMPQPQVQGTPNPMHMPKGIPSAVPRSMDPQYQQQQMMQQMMAQQMGQQQMGQQPRMGMKDGGIKLGPLEIKPRAEGIFSEEAYGPNEQRTWTDEIGLDAELDLPWGFELKGEYDKRRIKDRLYSPDDEYLDERVRADDDRWGLELVWKKKFGKGGKKFGKGGKKMNQGGRIGFAGGGMGRRTFMKIMAGLASLPFIGKGIQKTAPKVIPKVTEEVIKRGPDGIPKYVYDLIEVVKAKGTKEIMEGPYRKTPPSTKYEYKGVEVTEDGLGNVNVRSDKSGVATDPYTGKTREGIAQENHMEINRGGMGVKDEGLETQKAFQEPDEYFEGTVRPDRDGKMKDMEEGLDKEIHEFFKEIADEVKDIRPKKASGGRVPLGGGGILKVLKKINKKLKKIKKPEAYIMDQGYKLGKYYKKNPGKGLSHSTAVGTGVLISRHLDRQKRGKKASGGLAHMLGE
jgi:hypothetical protein